MRKKHHGQIVSMCILVVATVFLPFLTTSGSHSPSRIEYVIESACSGAGEFSGASTPVVSKKKLPIARARFMTLRRTWGEFMDYCKRRLNVRQIIKSGVQSALYVGGVYTFCRMIWSSLPSGSGTAAGGTLEQECALTPHVMVKQVTVARQVGSSCGYHAARNAMVLVDGLVHCRSDVGERLRDERSVAQLLDSKDAVWRSLVHDSREEWPSRLLDRGEIGRLFADERDNHRLGLRMWDDPENYITIIESVNEPHCKDPETLRGVDYDAIQRERNRARVQGVAYVHGFVLANMRQPVLMAGDVASSVQQQGYLKQELEKGSVGAHWTTAVLEQAPGGKTTYWVADSMGGKAAMRSLPVKNLIAALEGPGVAELLR